MVMDALRVSYQQHEVGAISFDRTTGLGAFQYEPSFIQQGIELSPLHMPLSTRIFSFPHLGFATFKGLPGLIADSLPDDFGHAVLNAWAATQGRNPNDITPLERLQYLGSRGMGALEFSPAKKLRSLNASQRVDIDALVAIAQDILDSRAAFKTDLSLQGNEDREAMLSLLSVGTSAGGARPKAVLAFNADFTQARSGQVAAPNGFTHYLMKFDGVSEHSAKQETFGDPLGFGAMEFVYSLLAKQCGINMMPCKLLSEGKRRHFITQRFDRIGNEKVHVQTLGGLAHVDYKMPGSFSYAELFSVARQLRLSATEAEQILRRLMFNIVARNHDDHPKNTAFTLRNGTWALAPAYDLAYSYKPDSRWVSSHWMSLNGKRDSFNRADFYSLERLVPRFTKSKIDNLLDEVIEHVSGWPALAKAWDVPAGLIKEVTNHLRLTI